MPRIDQRRLTLLVVLVAMLGMLGAVVADGWARHATPAVQAAVSSSDTVVDTAPVADTAVGVHRAGAATPGTRHAPHPAERAGFVQVGADHARTVAQAAPVLLVLAALVVWVPGGRSVLATVVRVVARRLPRAHVRRRGPPALAVV